MTAELLGIPCVTAVSNLDVAPGKGTARRKLQGPPKFSNFPLPGRRFN